MADSLASPTKKKKLPFKRTVSRRKPSHSPPLDDSLSHVASGSRPGGNGKNDNDDDDDDLDMFRRSRDFFPLAVQEQERRLKKEEKRRKAVTTEKQDPEEQETKRRRVSVSAASDESDDQHDTSPFRSGRPQASTGTPNTQSTSDFINAKSPTPLSGVSDLKGVGREKSVERTPRHEKGRDSRTPITREPSDHVITLDDDSDKGDMNGDGDDNPTMTTARRILNNDSSPLITPSLTIEDDEDSLPPFKTRTPGGLASVEDLDRSFTAPGSPDEFSKYILEAQEREARAQAERLEKARASQATTDAAGDSQQGSHGGSQDGPQLPKPTIKIMVSSILPDTVPMIAQLHFSQQLKIVRDAWIAHQKKKGHPIPDELQSQIFLTWKGNRVYATINCDSLGLDVDSNGKLRNRSHGEEQPGYHREGLHFQAWTEELYHEYLRGKEREQLRLFGQVDDEKASVEDDAAGEEGGTSIKIILKAQGHEPLATKVKMDTTATAISEVFRRMRNIPAGKTISLYFDGDNLGGDTTVQDAEIEDMDSLDVHIK